jgi:hypothetical protein
MIFHDMDEILRFSSKIPKGKDVTGNEEILHGLFRRRMEEGMIICMKLQKSICKASVPCRYTRQTEVKLHEFITPVCGQLHTLATLCPLPGRNPPLPVE